MTTLAAATAAVFLITRNGQQSLEPASGLDLFNPLTAFFAGGPCLAAAGPAGMGVFGGSNLADERGERRRAPGEAPRSLSGNGEGQAARPHDALRLLRQPGYQEQPCPGRAGVPARVLPGRTGRSLGCRHPLRVPPAPGAGLDEAVGPGPRGGRLPVESRAFVRDGGVLGISSYYPQRPLPEFPAHIQAVREQTEMLINAVRTPFQWHVEPSLRGLDKDGVHFTADFIATAEGMIFLEGGPPHELGAHPCCFREGRISGVALEDRNGGR